MWGGKSFSKTSLLLDAEPKLEPRTMRAESPSLGAPRGVWGLTWFDSQEIASSNAGRCRIYAKLQCGWAAKASRCAAASAMWCIPP